MITWLLRSGFIFAAYTLVMLHQFSAIQKRFFVYGPRTAEPAINDSTESEKSSTKARRHGKRGRSGNPLSRLLDYAASFSVPHSWFISFYVLSVLASTFWAYDYFHGKIYFHAVADVEARSRRVFAEGMQRIIDSTDDDKPFWLESLARRMSISGISGSEIRGGPSMTIEQVYICWMMMTIQGFRRLYECIEFGKSSKSRMWILHWVLGMAFYASMSLAVWIEGLPAIISADTQAHEVSLAKIPPIRAGIAVLVFLYASAIQHQAHKYLASLRTYTIPTHPIFKDVYCPHYTAEVGIYLAISVAATPLKAPEDGQWHLQPSSDEEGKWAVINWTILTAAVFVAANLGVTARGTRHWYESKFGVAAAGSRWGMIPYVV